jgi:hypothetical protein
MLRSLGFNNLPDQSTMGAITSSDVVVSHVPFTDGLLFHELVYVEQYRQQLGIAHFSDLTSLLWCTAISTIVTKNRSCGFNGLRTKTTVSKNGRILQGAS